ncbi:valine--tRNA ligase [Patescibacteria group bacterium]
MQDSNNIPEKFLKPYDPKETEDNIYKLWEESGFFNPDTCVEKGVCEADAETFCITMPPPNANGSLHAGHALFVTLEDIMIRYARMNGKKTLWYPGADHAGFETQVVYEKKLAKEGRSRFQMTREELYNEIMEFTLANKSHMEGQIRKLGASCDWSRELFTLDDRVVTTVYDTFKKLEEDELLYRGMRTVNWCPKHQTAFSNLEIENEERTDPFYYFQYGPFVIGTTRPETKFGDKYVVMHPDDKRYAEYKHGQKIDLEWINGPITATVIKDEAGDPEMGSGVMTITPWHSEIDFEIAQRHDLDYEQIIDERGKLLPIAEEFEGMPIKEARQEIVEKLDKKGLLVKIDEKYEHAVPTCYKCSREIEPQLKEQWFIKMKPLAKKAIEAIKTGDTKFVTERYERIALHWLENIRDWNISRQIAWGIPIPAKICDECDAGMIDIDNKITECTKCGGSVHTDPDTFDTWFSSSQWPFITLDYPNGKDFENFYPTNVMETGADILFFWVTRMMMMGLYRTEKVPFKTVYLHGLVNDKKGKKMSKSKGNVTNPIDITEQYGTDALRMSLIVGNTPGTDMNLSEDKIRAYKKFANKVWNISRFVTENTLDMAKEKPALIEADRLYLSELSDLTKDITKEIEKFNYHLASEKIYHYVWHRFADEIIEECKNRINEGSEEEKASAQFALQEILSTSLKLLHPFMPFITEEVWGLIQKEDNQILMVEKWPL